MEVVAQEQRPLGGMRKGGDHELAGARGRDRDQPRGQQECPARGGGEPALPEPGAAPGEDRPHAVREHQAYREVRGQQHERRRHGVERPGARPAAPDREADEQPVRRHRQERRERVVARHARVEKELGRECQQPRRRGRGAFVQDRPEGPEAERHRRHARHQRNQPQPHLAARPGLDGQPLEREEERRMKVSRQCAEQLAPRQRRPARGVDLVDPEPRAAEPREPEDERHRARDRKPQAAGRPHGADAEPRLHRATPDAPRAARSAVSARPPPCAAAASRAGPPARAGGAPAEARFSSASS